MPSTLVVNLFGGPSIGKSQVAMELSSSLRKCKIHCELVCEFAKDKVWEESLKVLENQLYILAKQEKRLRELQGKVDVIVTDSPLLLSLYYGAKETPVFHQLVLEKFNSYNNHNLMLKRELPYVQLGRLQTETEARAVDIGLADLMKKHSIPYEHFSSSDILCKTVDIVTGIRNKGIR